MRFCIATVEVLSCGVGAFEEIQIGTDTNTRCVNLILGQVAVGGVPRCA